MATLFISDLHLDESRPRAIALALDLIGNFANRFDTLYILGDLVEYWIGDDYCQPALLPVFAALATLSANNTQVRLMHGNRDFLISRTFAARYNIELLTDDAVRIDLFGVPTLLMHGDTLCSDDTDYQRFRAQTRDSRWQGDFLGKPLNERLEIVANLRATSKRAVANKRAGIMDVNQHSVVMALRQHKAHRLIHGHTHRPARHCFTIDDTATSRWVLGEWADDAAEIVICTPNACELMRWPDCRLVEAEKFPAS